jgi:hypothetical protein
MPAQSQSSEHIASVARYTFAHPWEVFIRRWNWKAALLSALFRGAAFALPMARLVGESSLRSLWIELGFRVAIGGFWGSLLQRFRNAQPAWLGGLAVAVALPGAHCLEYAALRAGGAAHIRTGMVVSVVITLGSLLINLGLMRRGLLITGEEGESLTSDLRRLPGALAGMLRGLFGRAVT